MIQTVMNHRLRTIAVLVLLFGLSPFGLFASAGSVSEDSHEMMQMHCVDGGECEEKERQCVEHCLELASISEQDQGALQRQELMVASEVEYISEFDYFNTDVVLIELDPRIDPRLNRITVQRE